MKMKKILALLLIILPLTMAAQNVDEEMMQVRGNVKFVNDANERIDAPDRLFYGVMPRKQANEVENKLREVINKYADSETDRELAIDEVRQANQIDKRAPKGNFKTNALPSMVIIMVAPEIGEYIRIDLQAGKEQYKDIPKQLKQVKGVDVTGQAQQVAINVSSTDDADDGNERFHIHILIPPGTARSDSRMLIQTYAVDCQTDDTLGYCASMIYEGEEYHEKQDRRMAYNYDKNDKLAQFYRTNAILREDRTFELDTIIVWPKPSAMKARSFRGPFTYAFEDFHHVYKFEDNDGTCLKRRPFKMLSFDAATSELPLTQEFYEVAESKFEKRDRKIDLRFEMGTSRLIQDSLNMVTQDKLVKELRGYGNSLAQVTIMGAASPDGSMKRNEELANQRVAVAQSIVAGKIPVTPKKEIKVYTWTDVANTLREQQKEEQAQAVEEIIQGGGDDQSLTSRMKALPFYPLDIEPVLVAQRTMRCSYMYQAKHVMTPDECVVEYYKNKPDYLEFTKHFSNGDYYNLFDMITDSLELDTITVMAYREITGEPDYQIENIIAPYVCNRYAIMQLKRGTPDVEILRPFIDLKRYGNGKSGVDVKQWTASRGMIQWNRHEIIANQAAAYYMEQKTDTALFLIDWLKGNNKMDSGLEQLENLINLKTLHFKARTPADEAKYQRAKAAVLEMSDDNKAILYTEIEDWKMRDIAPMWVDKMADDNPKKWYLKGLLAALNIEKEQPLIVTPSEPKDKKKDAAADTTFYKWSDDKLYDYQAEQYTDPAKAKALKEYQAKLLKYQKEHDGQDPPLEPAKKPEPKEDAAAEETPQAAAVDVTKFKDIPQYFGYFQRAFDLDKTKEFWRYYHAEQLVDEKLRKKYKYKIKNRPLYREMFELLKVRDAEIGFIPPTTGEDGDAAADGNEKAADEKKDEEGQK